ncbi:MAG: arylsulfotransferase family protein [Brevibacterium yomogidense]
MSANRRVRRGAAVLSAAVLVGVAGCSNGGGDDADEVELTEYESTDLTAPPIDLDSTDDDRSDEYFFVGPKSQETGLWSGKLIVDEDGEPVWIQEDEESDGSSEPTAGWDMRVQEYEGEKVLTWWEGIVDTPLAEGEVVVVDDSYEEIARVGMGNDLPHRMVDLHETTITDEGTMLLMAYVPKQADLTEIGGESDGWVWDGVVQEVDIETGEVLLDWSSLDHIPVTDSEREFEDDAGTEDKPYDYFHGNSVSVDDDGSLLVDARNTHAFYNVDRESGGVNWTLGGKSTDFEADDDLYFAWQHDVERSPDGTITLFDNQSSPTLGDSSRGMRIDVDTDEMTAELVQEFLPPVPRIAANQGSLQELEDGRVVIGWGALPSFTEYSADGEVLRDGTVGADSNYRAYLSEWEATPTEPPAADKKTEDDQTTVYASWNGATEVAQWRVLGGPDAGARTELATAERAGFETPIPLPEDADSVVVEALDEDGEVLGSATAD